MEAGQRLVFVKNTSQKIDTVEFQMSEIKNSVLPEMPVAPLEVWHSLRSHSRFN